MPTKTKATGQAAKKGKTAKKNACVAAELDSDMTSGEDEPSVRDVLRGLTTMMATMSTRLDDIEGDGRKKRRVAFRNYPAAGRSSEDEAAPETAGGYTVARRTAEEEVFTAAAGTSTSTSTHARPPPPHIQSTDPALIFSHPTAPPPTEADDHTRRPAPAALLPLPEVFYAVRASVAQRLRAPPTPFCLSEDESESDNDDSCYKKRRSVRSGKLRTLDTNVAVQIKWPHEMVHSASSQSVRCLCIVTCLWLHSLMDTSGLCVLKRIPR